MNEPSFNDDLRTWDPASRLVALVDHIRPRYRQNGIAGLNEAECTVLALFEFDNEICNGGFAQWLFNTPHQNLSRLRPVVLSELVRKTSWCI